MSIYKIAGLTVEMSVGGRTANQAKPYRTNYYKEININIETEEYKRRIYQEHGEIDEELCEYIATGASFYKQLLRNDGFMLHSSAVVVNQNVYLFAADSGTGKSTHTSLWIKLFRDKAYILNDDKPALRRVDGQWFAFGTPWSGKNDISVNTSALVKGIAVIERGENNKISRIGDLEAIMTIMRQCNRPRDPESRALLMELLDKLLVDVPIWKLQCNMEPEAAIVAYEAMSGQKYEGEWK